MMKFSSSLLLVIASAGAANNKPPNNARCLRQNDFTEGSKVITTGGSYKLCEDIVFHPNGPSSGETPAENAFDPVFNTTYNENNFGLGFFSAIAIAADNVQLYLNGHTIEQSPGHALFQRFFALIELADSPFIAGAGPAQFIEPGETIVSASNVKIIGPGTLGRSSHHGIHGNENSNIVIQDVTFRDFEVAAVSLNNVDVLKISNCTIEGNRKDVPVVGLFSAARFLRPYGKFLKDSNFTMQLYNSKTEAIEEKSAAQVYDALIDSINKVYRDVVYGSGFIDEMAHPAEHHLFNNPFRTVDGPFYGFLIHGRGPAIGGFGEVFNETHDSVTSSNIVIKGNKISDMKGWNNEVPALVSVNGNHGNVVNDVRGSVFQTIKTFETDSNKQMLAMDKKGKYNGNVVSDVQMMVAKAIHDGVLVNTPERQITPNSISAELDAWAQTGSVLTPSYVCNADSMHHVIKGGNVIRIDDTMDFTIEDNSIFNIENLSTKPFQSCDFFHAGASSENVGEQQGGNIRVISLAAVRGQSSRRNSIVRNNNILDVNSAQANSVIGIDVQGDSKNIGIMNNYVDLEPKLRTAGDISTATLDTAEVKSANLFKGTVVTLDTAEVESANLFTGTVVTDPDSLKLSRYLGARVREHVIGPVEFVGNTFVQGVEILNGQHLRGRALLSPERLKKIPGHGEIEWREGGCPFQSSYPVPKALHH